MWISVLQATVADDAGSGDAGDAGDAGEGDGW